MFDRAARRRQQPAAAGPLPPQPRQVRRAPARTRRRGEAVPGDPVRRADCGPCRCWTSRAAARRRPRPWPRGDQRAHPRRRPRACTSRTRGRRRDGQTRRRPRTGRRPGRTSCWRCAGVPELAASRRRRCSPPPTRTRPPSSRGRRARAAADVVQVPARPQPRRDHRVDGPQLPRRPGPQPRRDVARRGAAGAGRGPARRAEADAGR